MGASKNQAHGLLFHAQDYLLRTHKNSSRYNDVAKHSRCVK